MGNVDLDSGLKMGDVDSDSESDMSMGWGSCGCDCDCKCDVQRATLLRVSDSESRDIMSWVERRSECFFFREKQKGMFVDLTVVLW